jgi:hypothetical protein
MHVHACAHMRRVHVYALRTTHVRTHARAQTRARASPPPTRCRAPSAAQGPRPSASSAGPSPTHRRIECSGAHRLRAGAFAAATAFDRSERITSRWDLRLNDYSRLWPSSSAAPAVVRHLARRAQPHPIAHDHLHHRARSHPRSRAQLRPIPRHAATVVARPRRVGGCARRAPPGDRRFVAGRWRWRWRRSFSARTRTQIVPSALGRKLRSLRHQPESARGVAQRCRRKLRGAGARGCGCCGGMGATSAAGCARRAGAGLLP